MGWRLLILLLVSQNSECLHLTIQPDELSTVTLSTLPSVKCDICKLGDDAESACGSTLKISPSENVTVDMKCEEPQKAITVQIQSQIECSKSACAPVQCAVPSTLLSNFSRECVWELSPPEGTSLLVNFPGDGLNQVSQEKDCTNGYSYSLATIGSDGTVQKQLFCMSGSVSHVELHNQATVTLLLSPQVELDTKLFTVKPKTQQKKARAIEVTPDPDTRVIISKKDGVPSCLVCVGEDVSRICGQKQILEPSQITTVQFDCDNPQDAFDVEVNRDLDCTKTCNYDTIRPQNVFSNFDRVFTWDMKVSSSKTFQLEFPAPGLSQIQPSGQCPDKLIYSILMYPRSGTVSLGTFCRSGTITRMQILYKGRMTLKVPRDADLSSSEFRYKDATGTEQAVVDATLPREQKSTDFSTPNDIPSNSVMKWNFVVPPKHNSAVVFNTPVLPECQSKAVKITYMQENNAPIEKSLTDVQPATLEGSFSLTLTNCAKKTGSPGPVFTFSITVSKSGVPYVCTVDLQSEQGLSLQIESKNPSSYCELSMNSVVQEKITVPPGSKADLSFYECPSDDLLLTAIKTIECPGPLCLTSKTPLTAPALRSCPPVPINRVIWDLRVPEQGSVALSSSSGGLQQSVPGQECGSAASLLLSEPDGTSIGRFCHLGSQGIIQNLQIASNVTIMTIGDTTTSGKSSVPVLNVLFSSEVSDKLIYTISPLVSTPNILATPNWPGSVKSDSTVTWLVYVPEDYSAELQFINVSQPRCNQGHTRVTVQELGSRDEQGFREDQSSETLQIQRSFYLNMSNCEPEEGRFAILSKISLQKKSRKTLGIILGIVGTLLLIMIIVLVVVCVAVRKKKKKLTHRSSVFFPRGAVNFTGDASAPKPRGEKESPVYDYIDDTMVYGHLLKEDGYTQRDPGHYNGHQVDSYRTFTGPVDPTIKEAVCETDGGRGPEIDTYRPFLPPANTFTSTVGYEDRRMVDNELYTFKTLGDPIPLADEDSLPDKDSLPDPPSENEYDAAM